MNSQERELERALAVELEKEKQLMSVFEKLTDLCGEVTRARQSYEAAKARRKQLEK